MEKIMNYLQGAENASRQIIITIMNHIINNPDVTCKEFLATFLKENPHLYPQGKLSYKELQALPPRPMRY